MFKYIILLMIFINTAYANENCSEQQYLETEEVVYSVDTILPKHLKGATICITLHDGKSSCVPSEKYMIVPRKQKTVLGENKVITKSFRRTNTSTSDKKHMLFTDIRKDYKGLDIDINDTTATVETRKGLIPSINYYHRQVFDSPLGLGIGIDSNSTFRGIAGVEF